MVIGTPKDPETPWCHVMWHATETPSCIALAPYPPERPVDRKSYAEVVELWRAASRTPGDTFDAFYAAFDAAACGDWSRMRPDGSEADDATAAAERLRRRNGEALAALPYPAAVILYAIRYLCPRRCESVASVADWLAWIRADAQRNGTALPLTAGRRPSS